LLRQGRLWLPAGGGLAYLVHPYAGARLDLAFRAEGDCELAATLSPEDHPEVVTRRPAPAGRLVETFVDLAAVAGRVGRLSLAARGEGCRGIALQRAAIVMPGPAPAVRRPAKPRNLLFWMIDNARADRYKAYNPETRVSTPVIGELARGGTVFERAYIVGTESRVSHAALWTGLFPRQHRFISSKAVLDSRWVTLPEALRGAGLRTAAWIANGWISERWGFAEGWDVFHNTLHEGRGLSAGALADHAIDFLKKRGAERPFYLYLGTIDVHVSWRGKQPWLDRYDPGPYRGKYEKNVWGKDVDKMASGKVAVSERDRRRIIAMYDSNVSYNDQQLGRVLRALEAIGQREQTMVVITADHGEELWDFGRIGHGHSLREPLIAVPLIVHYPPLFGAGVRVAEGVDVLALMATMLDAVGAPVPDAVQGASLLPLAQGVGRGYPRPALATLYDRAYALRLEDHKIRMDSKGRAQTFDLAGPGGETAAVDARQPLAARWLTDVLSTFLVYQARWRQARWGVASNHLPALPTDLEQGTGPSPITPRGDGLKK
jgi:arylsulfatase A-like enzyme